MKSSAMKCFALIGVALFLGVAVAPSINADVKEPEIVEPDVVEKQFEKLVGLMEGIVSYYERAYEPSDCGCELEEPTPWSFPVICIYFFFLYAILFPFNIFFNIVFGIPLFAEIIIKTLDTAESMNCFWL